MMSPQSKMEKDLCQHLLNTHPEVLSKLKHLHQVEQQLQVIEFMHREQNIFEQEVIQEIGNTRNRIQIIKDRIQEAEFQDQEVQGQIREITQKINAKKANVQRLYLKQRQTDQQSELLKKQLGKISKSNKKFTQKQKRSQTTERLIAKFGLDQSNNKQNRNTINMKGNEEEKSQNMKSLQMDKLIQLKTQNQLYCSKIRKMKEELKHKIQVLEQRKKQKKTLTLELGNNKINNLVSSRKYAPKMQLNSYCSLNTTNT